MIFETERLFVRPLEEHDQEAFFELMSNPNVMHAIPQKPLNKEESDLKLSELILLEKTSNTKIWCICLKGQNNLIGFCGLLKNNEQDDEIAYRFIETHWYNGYGTEITKALIQHCFVSMHSKLVTADVFIENTKSIKILEKYFKFKNEFFNAEDNCIDRRYILKREDWKKMGMK